MSSKNTKKSKKFLTQLEDDLENFGIDVDFDHDIIVKGKKAMLRADLLGFDIELVVKTKSKNDWGKTKKMKLDLQYQGEDLGIVWKFDDISDASSSLDKEIANGSFDDALAFLADQDDIGDFNDYIEGLDGFKDSKFIVNGDVFN